MDQRNQFSCSRKIEFCDVTSPKVFLENEEDQFDVVIASLVFDVVALNILDFATFLENVVNIIKPGKKKWWKSQLLFLDFSILTLNFCFFSFTWSYFFRSNCWLFHIFNLKMEFCWFKAVWVNAFTPWAVRPSRRWTWLRKMWKRLLTNVDYAFEIGKPAKNNRRIILRCSTKVETSNWKSKLVIWLTFQVHVTPTNELKRLLWILQTFVALFKTC